MGGYLHNDAGRFKIEMSPEEKRKQVYGEYNQGDGLIYRKLNSPQRNSAKKRYWLLDTNKLYFIILA